MAVIRQRGATSFQAIVRVTVDGRKHTESRSFTSSRLAKEWASRLEAQLKLNGVPQRTKSQMTLGELILGHLQQVGKFKSVPSQTIYQLNRMAVRFADTKLNEMTAKVFTDYAHERTQDKVSGTTILHELVTLRGVMSSAYAVQNVEVPTDEIAKACNTLSRLGVIYPSKTRDRRPTEDELQRIFAAFAVSAKHCSAKIPMEKFVRLSIALPRRISELCAMRWADYHGDTILLRDTKDPTAPRDEIVPVPPEAQEIINSLPRLDERILPYISTSVTQRFERICNKLGIEDLRYHDLRHHGISLLFEQGLTIPEVSVVSGHKSWTMLKRYTNLRPGDITHKLKEINKALPKNNKKKDT